jgi:hypothetical protein
MGARARHLVPRPVRRVATRLLAERRASSVQHELATLVERGTPILVGPWLGEVGFELLYWVPFLRWFVESYNVSPERVVAVSRGGGAAAWYAPLAARAYDALSFVDPAEFKRRNLERTGTLGEQKQVASTALDAEIVEFVRQAEGQDVAVLHPSVMYRLYAPYWWGHQPLAWLKQYARFATLRPPVLPVELPPSYTAVKFYFNDCFTDTPANRAFVERTVRTLAERGPVISLSTGVAVDDHDPCEPDVAAMQGIRHLLTPDSNLRVQSSIVAGAQRFVGTYGGFAYLAPLCGVRATSYYSEPGSFSMRHLDLIRDVLSTEGRPDLLDVVASDGEPAR